MENVPSVKQCLALLKKERVAQSVLDHSIMVCRVASLLCDALQKNKVSVDKKLVLAGCLLHDVCKLEEINGKLSPRKFHEEAGANLLRERGYAAVAAVVEHHGLGPSGAFRSLEEKIVFYADKRVDWDEVVLIGERLKRLESRYAHLAGVPQKIRAAFARLQTVEGELLSLAGLRQEEFVSLNAFRGKGIGGLQ